MRWSLIGILFICFLRQILSVIERGEGSNKIKLKKRSLSSRIVEKEEEQVSKIIGKTSSFQSYHFQLNSNQRRFQLYLDTQVTDEIKGHIKVLWKHKNAYILPESLKTERVEVKILQDEKQIQSERFYTKAGFKIEIHKDKLYRIVVSQKRQANIEKLVSLSLEHFFESFQDVKIKDDKEKSPKKNHQQPQSDEQQSSSEEVSSQLSHNSQRFQYSQLHQRVELLLNQTKLLINQAQTKHLAEYTIEKYIEDSIHVYWMYEIVECSIVVLCVAVQVALVHRLFADKSIILLV